MGAEVKVSLVMLAPRSSAYCNIYSLVACAASLRLALAPCQSRKSVSKVFIDRPWLLARASERCTTVAPAWG